MFVKTIQRTAPRKGKLTVWTDDGEIFIRETVDRQTDTIAISPRELAKIVKLVEENPTTKTMPVPMEVK